MLAAALDGWVVVLDPRLGRLLALDERMQRVWRLCQGLTTEEIVSRLGEPPERIAPALRALEEAGLASLHDGTWVTAHLRWV